LALVDQNIEDIEQSLQKVNKSETETDGENDQNILEQEGLEPSELKEQYVESEQDNKD